MAGCVVLGTTVLPTTPLWGQTVPPDAAYRTLRTEHFRVTFPDGLEALGREAAVHAEAAHAILRADFRRPPEGVIDLVLTDHMDRSNGFALVLPSNRIVIWVQPPLDGLALSHFDNWLELVITHELAHLFHLDHTGPLGRTLRSVFGRVPRSWPYFVGHTLPILVIEGVAVHRESRDTLAGRLHGTFHEAIVRAQVLEGKAESVDQGLGRSPIWPGGDRPYVYGSLYFAYLAERFGEAAVVDFLESVAAQWIPYRLDSASRNAFGYSFDDLWQDWIETVELEVRSVRVRAEAPRPERLTEGGELAMYPVAGPEGVGVAYLRSDGRSDLRLVLMTQDGERTLSRWNTASAPPRWTVGGDLLIPQEEFVDAYRVHRELYMVSLDGGVRRWTQGLRVTHADPHPSGIGAIAVLGGEGTNRLALLSSEGEVETVLHEAEAGVHWSYPAWSPDGERIAVARRRLGGWTAVVVLDAGGALLHEVIEDRSQNTSPAWSPKGDALIWSSDRSGIPNLYGVLFSGQEFIPGPLRQITDLTTAGTYPSVDPAAEWIYLSWLGGDGWEAARIPYRQEAWFAPDPTAPRFRVDAPGGEVPAADSVRVVHSAQPVPRGESRPYSALATLLPRYWQPIHIEGERVRGTRVLPQAWGARTSGADLVGRHRYRVSVAAPIRDPGRRVEWRGRYDWAGLGNPIIGVEGAQVWETRAPLTIPGYGPPGAVVAPDTIYPMLKERTVGGVMAFRHQRIRRASVLSLGVRAVWQEWDFVEPGGGSEWTVQLVRPARTLGEGHIGFAMSSARAHPFSVSTERGAAFAVNARRRWDPSVPDSLAGRSGTDGTLREATGSIRLYRGIPGPGYANHVLALRAAGGLSDGPGAGENHFGLGGHSRFFPVRGLPPGVLWGSTAWAISGEWRFPLWVAHRGIRAWPLYLDRLAGSVFVDAAGSGRRSNGYSGDGSRIWQSRGSTGVELVVTHSTFFESPARLRLGMGIPFDDPVRPSVHLVTGWSF